MENNPNKWENPIDESTLKENKDYNLDDLYDHAHQELSLQQSKRDQIITIYLALCSFVIPFTLGEELIAWPIKGLIFLVIGIIGVLFSLASIRYREYKEIYWLTCQSITVLQNLKKEEINKDTIQQVFYRCLYKKGNKLVKDGKISFFNYVKKNIFSSETLHFIIISLIASFVVGMGSAMSIQAELWIQILAGSLIALLALCLLLYSYFSTCIKCYQLLAEPDAKKRDEMFSKVFSKAWFLHMYY